MGLDIQRQSLRQVALGPLACGGYIPVHAWDGSEIAWTDGKEFHPGRAWRCGYSGFDDIIKEVSAEKCHFQTWHKYGDVLGRGQNWGWNDFWPCAGNPQPGDYSGATQTLRQLDETTAGAIYHGGNVSTDTKHLLWSTYWHANIFGSGPTIGAILLMDRVATYEACPMATSTQTMDNTLAPQRYVGTGETGLQIVCTTQVNHTSNNGALASLTYIDNQGNSTALPNPSLITMNPQQTPSPLKAACVNTGDDGSPFLPLAPGDSGVRRIVSYTTNQTDATGLICFALVAPIAYIAVAEDTAIGWGMADYVRKTPQLVRIHDGACLNVMGLHRLNSTTNSLNGMFGFGWG